MKKLIGVMPLPNNFEVGDGLNTAGYRWVRRASGDEVPQGSSDDVNRDQVNLRLDHNFNSRNKLSLVGSREHVWADVYQPTWPGGWGGFADRWPRNYTVSFVSTLSPSVVVESRFGYRKGSVLREASQHNPKTGKAAYDWLPSANGFHFYVIPQTLGQTYFANTQTTAHRSPLTTFAETISRTQGKHAFKAGVEVRFAYSNAIQSAGLQWLPLANSGAGGVAVTGVNPPGINGADVTRARQLPGLAGSVASVVPLISAILSTRTISTWANGTPMKNHQNDFNFFVKDDWKVRKNLTLNLGVRYDRIGVPFETTGQVGLPSAETAACLGFRERA
jgi:outer membrane receptor protein involved in Fe transport